MKNIQSQTQLVICDDSFEPIMFAAITPNQAPIPMGVTLLQGNIYYIWILRSGGTVVKEN